MKVDELSGTCQKLPILNEPFTILTTDTRYPDKAAYFRTTKVLFIENDGKEILFKTANSEYLLGIYTVADGFRRTPPPW